MTGALYGPVLYDIHACDPPRTGHFTTCKLHALFQIGVGQAELAVREKPASPETLSNSAIRRELGRLVEPMASTRRGGELNKVAMRISVQCRILRKWIRFMGRPACTAKFVNTPDLSGFNPVKKALFI
ncbi:hypothetical protein CIHG_05933 [Coccidioides immitis H538.4]|uniref:Uncharacterized protein n=1 Tax=Coccidioides immitis H538.4 TaxID=396776 RepID=A0A0J8RQZ2_COCIT|nr:hypothetical protein CIHG_05933 [Coccidioides immitis H538.4]